MGDVQILGPGIQSLGFRVEVIEFTWDYSHALGGWFSKASGLGVRVQRV